MKTRQEKIIEAKKRSASSVDDTVVDKYLDKKFNKLFEKENKLRESAHKRTEATVKLFEENKQLFKKVHSDIVLLAKSTENAVVEQKKDIVALRKALQAVVEKMQSMVEIMAAIKIETPQINFEPNIELNEEKPIEYKPSDSTKKHHGYLSDSGKWYIMFVDGRANQKFRYATGTKDYEKNWAARYNLDYKRLDEVKL